jgi:hypothetical protein
VTETQLSKAILDALRAAGYVVWRNQSGTVRARRGVMHLAPKGTPDLVGYDPKTGLLIGVEVKLESGKVSQEQLDWLTDAFLAGCRTGVARTVVDALRISQGGQWVGP